MRMPLPPPPAAALTSTGNPTVPASFGSSEEGSVGTPASTAARLAASLSPMAATAWAGGPTHTSPAAATASAKAAFSERKP